MKTEDKKQQNDQNSESKNTQVTIEQNQIEELENQLKQEKERRLVAMADFDNYKKRVDKERKEMNMILNASMLNNIFEIQDDLKRAIADIAEPPMGLTMIQDKINSIINEYGVEEIKVQEGDSFEPTIMEAIGSVIVQDEKQINKVVHAERNAFKLKENGMLVRTARVIVGKK